MGARLQALLEVQEIELQIVDIRRQLERKQRQVASQDKKIREFQSSLEAERGEIRRLQAQFDELDVDIKARSHHIAKLREQLNGVRTNKEYHAILQQMNTEAADVKRIESRAMELMQQVEERKKSLAERGSSEGAEAQRLASLKAELEQMNQSFAARLQSLHARREAAGARLDRETLAMFTRLSERYEGEAMAELDRPNPRRDEYVCGGCNMSARVDLANALKTRDDVITCRNCGRILYLRSGV